MESKLCVAWLRIAFASEFSSVGDEPSLATGWWPLRRRGVDISLAVGATGDPGWAIGEGRDEGRLGGKEPSDDLYGEEGWTSL